METNISPLDLDKKRQDGTSVLIDVRSPEEFAEGHIEDSINIPLDDLKEMEKISFPTDGRIIYLICRSGRRSAIAFDILRARGYNELGILTEGLEAWAEAGLPLVKS